MSEDQALKRIVLTISVLSALSASLALMLSFNYGLSKVYIASAAFITLLFIGNILVAIFGTTFYSKLYYSVVTPFWYNVNIVLIGGGFGEGAAWMTNLAFAYVFFRGHKSKRPILLYIIFFFLFSIVYRDTFGPLIGFINLPYDGALTATVAAIWLMLIFEIYNREKEELIFDLQENNEELNRTAEELEQFTYSASHDLKTPLRNVSSFLDIIERKVHNKDYASLEEDVQFAKKGSTQMYSLVTEILEFTKVRNNLKEDYKEIELESVVQKVIIEMNKLYPSAEIVSLLAKNYTANEAHFYILFQNLILNGIKYNDNPKPKITIWDQNEDGLLKVYVKDNGIGISQEYHEQIFEFFKRLHNSSDYEGTGLGLGLCKKIVESYNGRISVSSTLGEGSTFFISLPR